VSVSSTQHLDRLDSILYTRPAGRNIIGFAIDEITRLRQELQIAESFHKVAVKERDAERVSNVIMRDKLERVEREAHGCREYGILCSTYHRGECDCFLAIIREGREGS
jgi:hypothetical protein